MRFTMVVELTDVLCLRNFGMFFNFSHLFCGAGRVDTMILHQQGKLLDMVNAKS